MPPTLGPLLQWAPAFRTIQWDQMGEMLTQDLETGWSRNSLETLSDAMMGPVIATQTTIASRYPSMHDPFLELPSASNAGSAGSPNAMSSLPLVVQTVCLPSPRPPQAVQVDMQNTSQSHPFDITPDPDSQSEERIGPEPSPSTCFVYVGKEKSESSGRGHAGRHPRRSMEQGAEGSRIRMNTAGRSLEKVKEMTEVVN